MGKKVAVVQSSYIPWKGYFDLINSVNEFVLYDDAQYTRRDWRSRNRIKTSQGIKWLTIPIEVKGKRHQRIDEAIVGDPHWNENHWKTISHNYAKAKYFKFYRDLFQQLYLRMNENFLSKINHLFITEICKILGIATKISWSCDFKLQEGKTERLINICKQAGAKEYISGPSAKNYLQEDLFVREGIKLSYFDYSNYPEYNQLFPPFDHEVSIVDLIFNEGPRASQFMKSF